MRYHDMRCSLWSVSSNGMLHCDADLKVLELTHNQIHMLPDDVGDLRHLECLYLRHNKLTNLPLLNNCTALKVSPLFTVHVCSYYQKMVLKLFVLII